MTSHLLEDAIEKGVHKLPYVWLQGLIEQKHDQHAADQHVQGDKRLMRTEFTGIDATLEILTEQRNPLLPKRDDLAQHGRSW